MATVLSYLTRAVAAAIWIFLWSLWLLLRTVAGLYLRLPVRWYLTPTLDIPLTIHPKHVITRASPEADRLRLALQQASSYETWLAIAKKLDEIELHTSRDLAAKKRKMIDDVSDDMTAMLKDVLDEDDNRFGMNLTGFSRRNFSAIARPEMFATAYTGKNATLSENFDAVVDRIDLFAKPRLGEEEWNGKEWKAAKLDAARTVFGRTSLVLQGGGVFALHHLGMTRALLQQGLLPDIIFGTSTGAWIAAIIAYLTDEEYLDAVDELSRHVLDALRNGGQALEPRMDWTALFSMGRRGFRQEAYEYERDIFAKYADSILGPTTTFREAHERTGRILNIEIACDTPATPNLLNYITTPNIIISTAARAAQTDDFDLAPTYIWEKSDYDGEIHLWSLFDETPEFRILRQKFRRPRGSAHLTLATSRDDPMRRMAQIFNTNHVIISQPRPYIFPFIRSDYFSRAQRPSFFPDTQAWVRRRIVSQWHTRVRQLAVLKDIPYRTQQLLLEDRAHTMTMTIAPDATFQEIERLVYHPSREAIDRCVLAGERSVWECAPFLHIRMDIEMVLEEHHQRKKG